MLAARARAPGRRRRRCRAARPTARRRSAAAARHAASASSSESVASSRYRVSSRRSMRLGIDLDAEDRRAGHRRRQGLRAAHAAEPGGEDRPPGEIGRPEVLLARRGERLVRALQDPLRADVDPAPGRHLAEHRQTLAPRAAGTRPSVAQRGTSSEFAIRTRGAHSCRPEDADGLAALNEQRLVVARGAAASARSPRSASWLRAALPVPP